MNIAAPEGFEPISLGPGFAQAFGQVYVNRASHSIGFRVAPHHVNPVGVCSGGALATFADMQIAGVMVHGPGSSDNHSPTISLSMDYVAVAPLGSWVEAAVTLVRKTRTMLFTQAILTTNGSAIVRSNAIYRLYEGGRSTKAKD